MRITRLYKEVTLLLLPLEPLRLVGAPVALLAGLVVNITRKKVERRNSRGEKWNVKEKKEDNPFIDEKKKKKKKKKRSQIPNVNIHTHTRTQK